MHIYPFIIKQNKDVFTDIANHYWNVEKNGQYAFSIMICFSMLLFNEKHMVDTLLTDIHNDINNDSSLNENQKNSYLAELQYIKAYTGYNDFNKMREEFNAIPSFSKSPVVPTSCLEIQVFFSESQILTVQYREFPIIIWLLCQPYMPKTSSRIAWSTLAFLYNRSEIPFSPILPTLHSISSACKLLIFNSTAIVPAPFKTQWTGCGKHLHWYTGYKSPASLLSAF